MIPTLVSSKLNSLRLCAICITLVICSFCANHAKADIDREYVLKSGFILNFARYTSNLMAEEDPSLILCSSDEPFVSTAKATLKDYRITNKNIVVQAVTTNTYKTAGCHIVFVSKADQSLWEEALHDSKNHKILYVGEGRDFLRSGGHIRFLISAGKIRFEVATKRLKKSRLNLSSKVIRLGFVYEGKQI